MEYGLIVDLETTGLDSQCDKIIEIGLVVFAVNTDYRLSIVSMYGGLQDPGEPLTQEIQDITGIGNGEIAGQEIDWDLVRREFARAEIVVAHNARFDRGFLAAAGKVDVDRVHWACSMQHIDWRAHGFTNQSLNYLACDHGFLNPFAHRALFDCATTFRLIAPYFEEMVRNSFERYSRIAALGSPFEAKDLLKQRGYRWDAEKRYWFKVLANSALESEREFLQAEIYKGKLLHQESPFNFWQAED